MSEKTAEQYFDELVTAEPSAKSDGKVTPIKKKERKKKRFKIQAARDFAAGELDEEYHVDGVIPKGEFVLIYGESSSGKTFLLTDMLCAITRGVDWNGIEVEKGRALYIAAESANNYKKRLRAYQSAFDCEWDDLPFVLGNAAPNLFNPTDVAVLAKNILDFGSGLIDVVAIDTLAAVTPGVNENSSDMNVVLDHIRFIHRKTGATIIVNHHAGKDASRGARGWSGLRAAAEAEIEVCRSADYRSARITKLRDGEDGAAYHFKLKPVFLGKSKKGKDITSCIVEHVEAPPKVAAKKIRLGPHENRIMTAVRANEGVTVAEVRKHAFDDTPHDPDDNKECTNIRKGLRRAIDSLCEKRFVFNRNNRLYLTNVEEITGDEFAWAE